MYASLIGKTFLVLVYFDSDCYIYSMNSLVPSIPNSSTECYSLSTLHMNIAKAGNQYSHDNLMHGTHIDGEHISGCLSILTHTIRAANNLEIIHKPDLWVARLQKVPNFQSNIIASNSLDKLCALYFEIRSSFCSE